MSDGGAARATTESHFPDLSPLRTGPRCACPRCGGGPLFSGFLAVAKCCSHCGLSFEFADGGDGAAWFVMLFVGVFGVGSILGMEAAYRPSFWIHLSVAVPLLVGLPLLLLRPVKAVLINVQYKTKAREGQFGS